MDSAPTNCCPRLDQHVHIKASDIRKVAERVLILTQREPDKADLVNIELYLAARAFLTRPEIREDEAEDAQNVIREFETWLATGGPKPELIAALFLPIQQVVND